MMIRSSLILMFLIATVSAVKAQKDEYVIGDRFFRYESILQDTTDLFSNIRIQEHFYPCVDDLSVTESSLRQGDFELISNTGYTEFYAYKDSILSLIGKKSTDPFLSISNMTIQFFKPIPLIKKLKPEQFRNQGNSEFFLSYKSKFWPQKLKNWAEDKGITEIRITGAVEWDNEFIRKDFFLKTFS